MFTEYKIGQVFYAEGDIEINSGLKFITLMVNNLGDRPIQIGSHFHFFEINKFLDFNREAAFGMRLDIPSGTAVRFEPGEEKTVQLVEYRGEKIMYGFNGLTMGSVSDPEVKRKAIEKAKTLSFKGA